MAVYGESSKMKLTFRGASRMRRGGRSMRRLCGRMSAVAIGLRVAVTHQFLGLAKQIDMKYYCYRCT